MFTKEIDLTPPNKKELLEFKRLSGFPMLFEEDGSDTIDISQDQIDSEDQIDPDDMSREEKEKLVKQVVDYRGNIVWDGTRPNSKPVKKKPSKK